MPLHQVFLSYGTGEFLRYFGFLLTLVIDIMAMTMGRKYSCCYCSVVRLWESYMKPSFSGVLFSSGSHLFFFFLLCMVSRFRFPRLLFAKIPVVLSFFLFLISLKSTFTIFL